MITTTTRTMYRAEGARFWRASKRSALMDAARLLWAKKNPCECERPDHASGYPGFTCGVHSPEMVQRRGDVCARLVRLWMRRDRLAKKSAPQYYMQDSRGYVGNAMLFWAKGGHGYTTHLEEAQEYTAEQAKRMHKNRRTDKPVKISAARAAASTQVDVQRIRKRKA